MSHHSSKQKMPQLDVLSLKQERESARHFVSTSTLTVNTRQHRNSSFANSYANEHVFSTNLEVKTLIILKQTVNTLVKAKYCTLRLPCHFELSTLLCPRHTNQAVMSRCTCQLITRCGADETSPTFQSLIHAVCYVFSKHQQEQWYYIKAYA